MNNRITKKIVKRYGASWLVFYKRYSRKLNKWLDDGVGFKIPSRWDNKNTRKLMYKKFSFLNLRKEN